MKKLIITAIFLLGTTLIFSQSDEEMLKRVLQGRINDIFKRWDDNWSADKYIGETALISYFEESTYSDDMIVAHGTFTVNRTVIFTTKLNVKFTCNLKANSDGSMTISNLCYKDSSVDMEDCCDPSDWGLGRL